MSIVELEERIASLDPETRAAAERIFSVTTTVGRLDPPVEMREWITKQFGSVDAVIAQTVVRVTNLVTFEGALFNDLRARRPAEVKGGADTRETIEKARGDPFCHPESGTPADTFGRIKGAHGITASNVAKYDGYHGVLVFDDLWRVHEALGLGVERGGARVFASLTPVKESEVVILGRAGEDEVTLAPALALAIGAFRARGVVAYNFALFLPPLSTDGNDWRRFPPQARLVDRGDPANKTSDIGGMELYAAGVVAGDPFRLAEVLRS
ncbi:MAG: hypothetical protein E6I20_08710 [Chloroflexi bacterium]|nr:MAG: hypothetical protein E6I20_08710 [Chloroflexota bacterium]